MSDQRIHLVDTPPPRCSSCFGQYPDRRHVDFAATWDGPTFDDEKVAGHTTVAIDDLIVCEDCLKEAADRLGLGDVAEARQALEDQQSELETLRERLRGALDALKSAEQATAKREQLEGIMARSEPAAA